MKSSKVSFDFTDSPKILEVLRVMSAKKRKTQKAIVVEALERYFADEEDNLFLSLVADKTFAEWDNPEDKIYDSLRRGVSPISVFRSD